LELHILPFGEGLEPLHRDRGEVHEHVLAVGLLNEAVALGVIEPLHLTSGHRTASYEVGPRQQYSTPARTKLHQRVPQCQEKSRWGSRRFCKLTEMQGVSGPASRRRRGSGRPPDTR